MFRWIVASDEIWIFYQVWSFILARCLSFLIYLRKKGINIVENYFSTLLKKHEIETNENIFIQWPRLFKSHKYFMRVQLLDLIRCRGFVRGWNNRISLSSRNTCLIYIFTRSPFVSLNFQCESTSIVFYPNYS